jgi:phospholipid/cholesterol/gamma-HCH transport system ATP-binding protein
LTRVTGKTENPPKTGGPENPPAGGASSPAFELEGVFLSFWEKKVLRGMDLVLEKGGKLSLVGESSCGKSTVLKVIAGLLPPDSGTVRLFSEKLGDLSLGKLEKLRRGVGMQFQAGALFDSMSVRENLVLAVSEGYRGRRRAPGKKTEEEIMSLLDRVGLKRAASRNPAGLSGGMRKRAAIARALIVRPELAMFDEPTAGLDPLTGGSIIKLLNELAEDIGAAMLLTTTDLDAARRFSDDIAIMKDGVILARGTLEDHLNSPDPYLKKFTGRLAKLKKL